MMKTIKNVALYFLFFSSTILADIIHVPADTTSIQAGIDMANPGDTVLVADSTYFENINFLGKAITVASHFLVDGEMAHISKTVINGGQSNSPDSGSVVFFVSGEDTTSVLCGFTITGGSGTQVLPGVMAGGAIFCGSNSGAKIMHNIISSNTLVSDNVAGGAVTSGPPGSPAIVIIRFNEIKNNVIEGKDDAVGGAILLHSSGVITNNNIHHNRVHSTGGNAEGGGIHSGSEFAGKSFVIENNIIRQNKSESTGTYGRGAGIYVSSSMYTTQITRNTIRQNYASHAGGGIGCYNSSNPEIKNNLIAYNSTGEDAGGVDIYDNSNPSLINNTIVHNHAPLGGGALAFNLNCDPVIINTIIYGNSAGSGGSQVQFWDDESDPTFTYCDIEGGILGFGFYESSFTYTGSYKNNIDSDPLFEDGDSLFYLSAGSPCKDAGDPHLSFNDREDPLNLGYALWPSIGEIRNDMGAYGGPYVLTTSIEVNDEIDRIIPSEITLYQNFPNPFNPKTVIRYYLPLSSTIDLSVYNVLGQKVETLVSSKQPAGNYSIEWNATNFSSGIYFYTLHISSGVVQTKKMVVLR
jgi:hypothetical protein